ncbi:hypothetical protein H0A36_28645 [Endozoicomonas sp. SM1973]|uniref:Immunity MXAN-0049 protein domain-containing protein n=1 Tax=Spartinivicinus marinus TaxID=2994442 RepID=A0A853IKV1_9GAMM|nr:DUF1629 domain-containing protein [Spartinivicinus marinus]MCX4030507.1 hypothetical protein [Spartinivicinus marinus]NYZ69987.1 hypothetical protein [Spartinivicinus marinus]
MDDLLPKSMYWILISERSDDNQFYLDGTPPLISTNEWSFEEGSAVTGIIPEIEMLYTIEPNEIMTDNLVSPGFRGLLIRNKVKGLLEILGLDNIQYFKTKLINEKTKESTEDYYIANIIGTYDCVDYDKSDLTFWDDGDIEFVESFVFKDISDQEPPEIFRLSSFLPLVIITDRVKKALDKQDYSGFKYYRPEEYYS